MVIRFPPLFFKLHHHLSISIYLSLLLTSFLITLKKNVKKVLFLWRQHDAKKVAHTTPTQNIHPQPLYTTLIYYIFCVFWFIIMWKWIRLCFVCAIIMVSIYNMKTPVIGINYKKSKYIREIHSNDCEIFFWVFYLYSLYFSFFPSS